VTQMRKKMLEELRRRNYSHRTARTYVPIVRDFAEYFQQPPVKRRWGGRCPSISFRVWTFGQALLYFRSHETATQVRTIVDQLERRFGSGNFEYLVWAQ
jgi:hypothetical protein